LIGIADELELIFDELEVAFDLFLWIIVVK